MREAIKNFNFKTDSLMLTFIPILNLLRIDVDRPMKEVPNGFDYLYELRARLPETLQFLLSENEGTWRKVLDFLQKHKNQMFIGDSYTKANEKAVAMPVQTRFQARSNGRGRVRDDQRFQHTPTPP